MDLEAQVAGFGGFDAMNAAFGRGLTLLAQGAGLVGLDLIANAAALASGDQNAFRLTH